MELVLSSNGYPTLLGIPVIYIEHSFKKLSFWFLFMVLVVSMPIRSVYPFYTQGILHGAIIMCVALGQVDLKSIFCCVGVFACYMSGISFQYGCIQTLFLVFIYLLFQYIYSN